MTPPDYEIRARKVVGSPHTSYTLVYRGQVLRSQLSPISEADAADHIRLHLAPLPSRTDDMRVFLKTGKPGPKPKRSPSVTATGFRWKDED